jgi:hypothetical protein
MKIFRSIDQKIVDFANLFIPEMQMLLKKHGVTDSESILLRLIENQLELVEKAVKCPNVTYDNVANLTSNESLN